jgi:hypothetical protein
MAPSSQSSSDASCRKPLRQELRDFQEIREPSIHGAFAQRVRDWYLAIQLSSTRGTPKLRG